MKQVFEKISIRSSDYVAAVNVEDSDVLSDLFSSCKKMVCAGRICKKEFKGLKDVLVVKSPSALDESIFNKVLTTYDESLNLKSLVRVADNLAMVLIVGVPSEKLDIFENLLNQKAGIFETWSFQGERKDTVDFLFRVRKY